MILLSILIPTIDERKYSFKKLCERLRASCDYELLQQIEIISDDRGRYISIGQKRNDLLKKAEGKYVCFFDDDDRPCENYVNKLLKAISSDPDCVSLRGIITVDGKDPQIFEHSIKYTAYRTTLNEVKYERYPNHLNTIRASIAKQFKFPEISFGEDTDWATQIYKSGLLKTEVYLSEVIYYYQYKNK